MLTSAIANALLTAWDEGTIVSSLVARHPAFNIDDAYAVSAELINLRRARGEKTVGRKIGFTNRNIWRQYGATSPIWHHVYDSTAVYANGGKATLSLTNSAQPLIEPEIAFKLRAPMPVNCNDPAEILRAIEWVAPSFEIVCCHFAGWKCTPAEFVADSSLHWRLVVGAPVAVTDDKLSVLAEQLRDCNITLNKNGDVMDRGTGSNALDHPALALGFLANVLARQPAFDPLAAGEIITTGTLTAALPVKAGETWQSRYDHLPGVQGLTITFTDG
ncbi:MAG: fumarylacetoacetate hydrolase family protein [Burkholderiales bacterium]